MSVVISGYQGSGAPEVIKVADKRHLNYVDWELIAEVARRLKWSKQGIEQKEKPPGTFGDWIVEVLRCTCLSGTGYIEAYVPAREMHLDGWCSQSLLKDYP